MLPTPKAVVTARQSSEARSANWEITTQATITMKWILLKLRPRNWDNPSA